MRPNPRQLYGARVEAQVEAHHEPTGRVRRIALPLDRVLLPFRRQRELPRQRLLPGIHRNLQERVYLTRFPTARPEPKLQPVPLLDESLHIPHELYRPCVLSLGGLQFQPHVSVEVADLTLHNRRIALSVLPHSPAPHAVGEVSVLDQVRQLLCRANGCQSAQQYGQYDSHGGLLSSGVRARGPWRRRTPRTIRRTQP